MRLALYLVPDFSQMLLHQSPRTFIIFLFDSINDLDMVFKRCRHLRLTQKSERTTFAYYLVHKGEDFDEDLIF